MKKRETFTNFLLTLYAINAKDEYILEIRMGLMCSLYETIFQKVCPV